MLVVHIIWSFQSFIGFIWEVFRAEGGGGFYQAIATYKYQRAAVAEHRFSFSLLLLNI